MARPDTTRIDDREVVSTRSSAEPTRVVARPVDQLVAPAIGDDALVQLAAGLSALNPSLEKYVREKNTNDALDANAAGVKAAQQAALSPVAAISSPAAMPERIEPAFRHQFDVGYRETMGKRIAAEHSDQFLSEYNRERNRPDFDSERFIREWTAKNATGFDDEIVLNEVYRAQQDTVRAIRTDQRALQLKRIGEDAVANAQASLSAVRADMTTEERFAAFQSAVPAAVASGFVTRAEMNKNLFARVTALSTQVGGAPEMYDIFDMKDPATGRTISELNPELAAQVASARQQASRQAEQRRQQARQPMDFDTKLRWEEAADRGQMPDAAVLRAHIGPDGMFRTDSEALSYMHSLRTRAEKASEGAYAAWALSNKWGFLLKPEAQKKALEGLTAPALGQYLEASRTEGATQAAAMFAQQIIDAHGELGASVTAAPLERAFENIKQWNPKAGTQPPADFLALAELYRKMTPGLRAAYAKDEDVRGILDSYTQQMSSGHGNRETAFSLAFNSVSPEAKKAAHEFVSNPENRDRIRSWVKGEFQKDGWTPNFLRAQWMGTYPRNEEQVFAWAQQQAEGLLRTEPSLYGTPQLKERLVGMVERSWSYDSTSDSLVYTPGRASPTMSAALSEYTSELNKKMPDADVAVSADGAGMYDVRSRKGGFLIKKVSLSEIELDYAAKRVWDGRTNEGQRYHELERAILNGTATPELLKDNAQLLSKARALGILEARPELQGRIRELHERAFKDSILAPLDSPPKMPAELPPGTIPTGQVGVSKATIATSLWAQQRHGMALTALSEGLVLKAYPDPSKGTNIGFGYNMEANAATLERDFRAAGIPAESIAGIKAGRTSITEVQAQRLLAVAYGRAEATARSHIETTYGKGAWAKLPVTKQAVLTDVAYQAGSPSLFPQSVDKLVKDIGELKAQNPVVHYRDRNSGQMVPDARRNDLRLRMLSGLHSFDVLLAEVARRPKTAIESAALNQ